MAKTVAEPGYKTYWLTWGILLAMTIAMLVTGSASLPKLFAAVLLLVAMMVKASLIGGQFMHLRFEKLGLVLAVTGAILMVSAFLFVLISFDGVRILKLSQP